VPWQKLVIVVTGPGVDATHANESPESDDPVHSLVGAPLQSPVGESQDVVDTTTLTGMVTTKAGSPGFTGGMFLMVNDRLPGVHCTVPLGAVGFAVMLTPGRLAGMPMVMELKVELPVGDTFLNHAVNEFVVDVRFDGDMSSE